MYPTTNLYISRLCRYCLEEEKKLGQNDESRDGGNYIRYRRYALSSLLINGNVIACIPGGRTVPGQVSRVRSPVGERHVRAESDGRCLAEPQTVASAAETDQSCPQRCRYAAAAERRTDSISSN